MQIFTVTLSIGSFIWELLWVFIGPILALGIGFLCATAGIIGACYIISSELIGTQPKVRTKKNKRVAKAKKVPITNSPLFMACLQKIADSQLDSLYVNSHMACFNFGGTSISFSGIGISEDSVLDFVKAGYEPIDEERVPQYCEQLIAAARKLPNVASVSQNKFYYLPQPYLIANGRYNMPGDDLQFWEFKYRVVNTKKLKSFKVK